MQLNAYINFNGQCEAAFKFYEQCLGGKLEALVPFEGTPAAEHVSPEWNSKIMHAHLIVDGSSLMGSDDMSDKFEAPKGFHITIQITDPARAEKIFKDMSEGGTVTMPIQQTFWAARFGMLVDKFGIPWMVNCDQPEQAA
jgi:PhnB protein